MRIAGLFLSTDTTNNTKFFLCHQMNPMNLIFFLLPTDDTNITKFSPYHQMNQMNRMPGAMYCLVHLVCLVKISMIATFVFFVFSVGKKHYIVRWSQ